MSLTGRARLRRSRVTGWCRLHHVGPFVGSLAVLAATTVATAGPSAAAGILPPANPPANIPMTGTSTCQAGPNGSPDSTPACVGSDLAAIDTARSAEGVGPMILPTDYAQLSGPEQLFVVTNLERVDRGVPPMVGLTDPLNALAAQGAAQGTDPPFPAQGITWAGSVWAGGFDSTLEAVYGWMYDDGPGSTNIDCGSASSAGCWGHRDVILTAPTGAGVVAGAADATGPAGPQYTMLLAQYVGAEPPLSYTWADAVANGAGLVPPAGVVRLAGTDRVATADVVSESTWGALGQGGLHAASAVIARSDAFPDALAAVPLAAAKDGPLLLTSPGSLDPRTLAEIQRILPHGATVYLVGGDNALSPGIAAALVHAGYVPVRIAGPDRFATATAIAGELGNPSTVFEADGLNFADALAAGPAAATVHGAVLLTNGASQSSATAAYLGAHHPLTYAIGGPAAAADPSAHAIVGSDRFATASRVAGEFFPDPMHIGIATGFDYPDALAAGAQLAQAGGPLLLVAATPPVPAPTVRYLTAHPLATATLYGGLAAVPSAVAASL
jgi:putative cell wall-binding protein